jgi:hypothetical protein
LPLECHQRLHGALRQRCKEIHPTGAKPAAS